MPSSGTNRFLTTLDCDLNGDGTITFPDHTVYVDFSLFGFKPANSATTYVFTLTDDSGFLVYSSGDDTCVGDFTDWLCLKARGGYTLAIDSDRASESFDVQILYT